MPRSDPSHCPSLTSSVDSATSSSLPSPQESTAGRSQRRNSKFPLDSSPIRLPSIRRMSTPNHSRRLSLTGSPPSSPTTFLNQPNINFESSLKSRFSDAQRQRYRPYTPRSGIILPGLLYAARSFGITSPTDLSIDEVKESADMFADVLSAMPDSILLSALDLKRADYDRLALRLALTTAEIKCTERRQAFLSNMRKQNDGDLAIGGACLDILERLLGMRGLVEAESSQHHKDARLKELVALSIAELHAAKLQDLVGSQGSRWFRRGNEHERVFSDDEVEKVFSEDEDDEDCDSSEGSNA